LRGTFISVLSLLVVTFACTKGPLYLPDPEDVPSGSPIVTVIYDPGALGDMTYNDLIYEGVERAAVRYGLRTRQLSPRSQEEGMAYLSSILGELSSARDTTRHLLIVPGLSYEGYLRANNRRLEGNPRADLLLFESKDPFEGKGSTLHISLYGAMYEAGAVTPAFSDEVLVVAANPTDTGVADALAGFQAGFATNYVLPKDQKRLFLTYLSDEPGAGFTVDEATALDLMYSQPWSSSGTIVPICGGANAVFRRLSEFTTGYFQVMGIDRVIPSTSCPYAAVKHSDEAVEHCIGQWLSAEGLPKHQTLGLSDGYSEMVFCPADAGEMDQIDKLLPAQVREAIHKEALEKEAQYGK